MTRRVGRNATNPSSTAGFSSPSLCRSLFQNPQRHSDCCALACCGLLLSDRTYHARTHAMPTSWWNRCLLYLGLPVGAFVSVQCVWKNEYYSLIALTSVVLLLCLWGWWCRYHQRRDLFRLLYETQQQQPQVDEQDHDVDALLQQQCCANVMATAICGCVPAVPLNEEQDDNYASADDAIALNAESMAFSSRPDLCTRLWNALANMCCGCVCSCWCQCCGLCAIAQQDLQLQRLQYATTPTTTTTASVRIDYITFEPFDDYAIKLQRLRIEQETSMWQHLSNMSKLSYKLLAILAWSLVVLAIVASLQVDRDLNLSTLLVVIATFCQAFLILYFVHWRWNRFDLSLDAVVKYFSSGFVLCTGMAVVFEILVSTLLGFFVNLIVLLTAIVQEAEMPSTPQEAREFQQEFARQHLPLFVFFTFLNAFLVAAWVEETTKYFGFWMVEHPDVEGSSSADDHVVNGKRESRGVAITVAMVATALGFACCENLLYVFVYTPPTLANEVTTLVARSVFPIHPLAAALQSIGVCRRDLEKERKVGLGRILFPAILLHGSFDFVLMAIALIQNVQDADTTATFDDDVLVIDDDADDDDDTASMSQASTAHDVHDELASLIASVVIVLVGLVYYIWQAETQRMRLHELDRGARPNRETTPLLAV